MTLLIQRDQSQSPPATAWTVSAILATDDPVPVYDFDRGEVIPEILFMDGMRLNGDSVPLLDVHNRESVEHVLGSVRGIDRRSHSAVGTLHFAESSGSEQAKVRDGHITDVSVGYRVLKKKYVPDGTVKFVGDRLIEGPASAVTSWRLSEVSLVPIGADPRAKIGSRSESSKTTRRRRFRIEPGPPPRTLRFDPSSKRFVLTLGTIRIAGLLIGHEIRQLVERFETQFYDPQARARAIDRFTRAVLKDAERRSRHVKLESILCTRDAMPWSERDGRSIDAFARRFLAK